MHLYLIRHGQSYVNLPDFEDGNVDAGLTPLGQQQAQRLGPWLKKHVPDVDVIYSSTMKRARETAAPIIAAYSIEARYDDRLREIGNNRRDHSAWPNDALPTYGEFWGSEAPFKPITREPDSESLSHFRARVGAFIEETLERHRQQTILVVCHGGVIDLAYDHIFNIGPWRRTEVHVWNTGITHFEYVDHPDREKWRLYFHNRVEHLGDLSPT